MPDDQDLLSIPVDTWPKGMVRKWLAQDPALQGLVDVLQVHTRHATAQTSLQDLGSSILCCHPLRYHCKQPTTLRLERPKFSRTWMERS